MSMDQKLGPKLMKDNSDLLSEFEMAKDRSEPVVFSSQETDNTFTLTAHLRGYNRGDLKVGIINDGNLIAISGQKQVTETIMVDWKVYKKDRLVRGFKKVFKIPDNVISDMIESRFDHNRSMLSIRMPKKVKVIQGISIEEVKDSKDLVSDDYGYESLQILNEEKSLEDVKPYTRDESMNLGTQTVEDVEYKELDHVDKSKQSEKKTNDVLEKDGEEQVKSDRAERCKWCTVMGSALLVSLVAFVIHVVQAKNQSRRSKD